MRDLQGRITRRQTRLQSRMEHEQPDVLTTTEVDELTCGLASRAPASGMMRVMRFAYHGESGQPRTYVRRISEEWVALDLILGDYFAGIPVA